MRSRQDVLQDYSAFFGHKSDEVPRNVIAARRRRGRTTTFYVCCVPGRPNTFTSSPRAESVWMGWYAAAKDYDGFLRWALNMWNRDPLRTTDYGNWPSGDALLLYPGPRSSVRFELLREGIEDYAKIRIPRAELRNKGEKGKQQLKELDQILKRFDYPNCGSDEHILDSVVRGRRLLIQLSRQSLFDLLRQSSHHCRLAGESVPSDGLKTGLPPSPVSTRFFRILENP